jgi:hypothetical protein
VGFTSLQFYENIASVRRNECKVTCEMFQEGVVVLEGFEYKCLKYSKLWGKCLESRRRFSNFKELIEEHHSR